MDLAITFSIGEWRHFEKWAEVGVRGDRVLAYLRCGARQQRGFGRVASNRGQQRQLLERAIEGKSGGRERIGRNRALAFQRARRGRGLARRFFGFRRQIGGDPFADAALQRRRAIALTNQLSGDARARQLVRIGIVDDDLAIARQRRRR